MPYVLCRFVIGSKATLKITEQLYKDIRDANAGLGEIIAVEEKVDALMENYVELESTLLTLGARHLAFVDSDLKDLLGPRNLISRRVLNRSGYRPPAPQTFAPSARHLDEIMPML